MTEPNYKQHIGLLSPLVDRWRVKKVAPFIKENARVLDIGCGSCLLTDYLPAGVSYEGVDLDKNLIAFNTKRFPNFKFQSFDVCQDTFPYPDGHFDVVVMTAFLEHVDDATPLMKEVGRVLKAGGCALGTTPSDRGGRVHDVLSHMGLLSHHAAEEHKGFLNESSMKELGLSAGLQLSHYHTFQWGMNQFFVFRK